MYIFSTWCIFYSKAMNNVGLSWLMVHQNFFIHLYYRIVIFMYRYMAICEFKRVVNFPVTSSHLKWTIRSHCSLVRTYLPINELQFHVEFFHDAPLFQRSSIKWPIGQVFNIINWITYVQRSTWVYSHRKSEFERSFIEIR